MYVEEIDLNLLQPFRHTLGVTRRRIGELTTLDQDGECDTQRLHYHLNFQHSDVLFCWPINSSAPHHTIPNMQRITRLLSLTADIMSAECITATVTCVADCLCIATINQSMK